MIRVFHLISSLVSGGAEMMLFKILSGMDCSRFQSFLTNWPAYQYEIRVWGCRRSPISLDSSAVITR